MKKLFFIGISVFIVFFIAATTTWFVFDKDKYDTQNYDKTFQQDIFNRLDVKLDNSNLTLKKGSQFKITYNGDNHIQTKIKDKCLKVRDSQNKNRGYSTDLNPFYHNKKQLTIEVPDNKIKSLNIDMDAGHLKISGIALNDSNIINHTGDFNLDNVQFDNVNLYTNFSKDLYIKNSNIVNSDFKLKGGKLSIINSKLKQTIFINDHGEVKFKKMPAQSDVKASTKEGDISFEYAEKPVNTILKLNPGTGKSLIHNKAFKNGKVGNSDNVLEFYTIDGDIDID
ncbi:DUF4097 family beta strand repeat protein [Staphylococcus simiae]|uniref:DUF4097 family beta strand repeat-containing protein n=1 Tax=Staphylococcus simiae TaxID=308354 RepID=UPI001A95E646|nr:DUF4097 family beta strand repeat-containing protein [Staphylococcus simiae]MBO1198346.1 DUF4097 family beta strand repeat protein [Staphylococcus simiae]MBO1200362.1 DUF4097 family beta strand repeat protein [Staphylococcus simiae]MBO1202635.1 DUF4097 family beta strand repeat protein [Staphylococcus simiae]MBO1210338.1 DUF4097 family beta strand repeat protein [Staphylococcus simiae]MBO1228791.1 DUF4097 family beta strand repeat protein [Staphylococcus simiae]